VRENFPDSPVEPHRISLIAAVTRGLFAACGTSLTYPQRRPRRRDRRDARDLDEPTLLAPQMHLWVGDSKLP